MPEYRTRLPALMAGLLEAAVNRLLALDDSSVTHLERLEGKVLRVDIEGLSISLFLTFQYGAVQVSLESETPPDTVIGGTPVALFAMSAPEEVADWGVPGSGVNISGDAALARDLGRLFSGLDPDWETPLAGMVGDTLGYQVASGLRHGAGAVWEAGRSAANLTASYFRDESRILVSAAEVKAFGTKVDELRDRIGRLQVRLDRIRERGR